MSGTVLGFCSRWRGLVCFSGLVPHRWFLWRWWEVDQSKNTNKQFSVQLKGYHLRGLIIYQGFCDTKNYICRWMFVSIISKPTIPQQRQLFLLPILRMRKPSHREVRSLDQGPSGIKCWARFWKHNFLTWKPAGSILQSTLVSISLTFIMTIDTWKKGWERSSNWPVALSESGSPSAQPLLPGPPALPIWVSHLVIILNGPHGWFRQEVETVFELGFERS